MEGGVLWALALLAALEEHWEKRSATGMSAYDPNRLDVGRLGELLTLHGLPAQPPEMLETGKPQPWVRDEFADSGIGTEEDLARYFGQQFWFGCESDDFGVHRALDGRGNPLGVTFRPLFSSDFGHWDVPRLTDVLPHSRNLVDKGLLSEAGYRCFTFEAAAKLYAEINPTFFHGTAVEADVAKLLLG